MDEEKPQAPKKPRFKYKKRMGCLPRMLIAIIFIAVVLAIIMVIHYQFFVKPANPDITLKDYFALNWESTKKTVGRYKDKAIEWKEWLAKSDKTMEWLDDMFPTGDKAGGEGPVAAAPVEGEKTPEKPDTPVEETPESAPKTGIHPELRAAADEFRAGLIHFRKRENNEAYQRFRSAQDHIENYRKVNPGDPQITEFEEELAPYIQAAMKDSKLK